jgi:hypothetical protein
VRRAFVFVPDAARVPFSLAPQRLMFAPALPQRAGNLALPMPILNPPSGPQTLMPEPQLVSVKNFAVIVAGVAGAVKEEGS